MSGKGREHDEDDDDDDDDEEEVQQPPKKRTKKTSFIEDAAEESGDDGDDDDDDDDGSDDNEYVNDGFVVDEAEVPKERKDDLEDSDDDDASDDDDEASDTKERKRLQKVRKVQERLDDEDMALIHEAQARERGEDILPKAVVAKTEEELRKGLFVDSDDDEVEGQQQAQVAKKPARVDRYDEYGMDDFIEDDIGDQDAIRAADRRDYDEGEANEISEAQLNEASEIFGTDYLDFMQEDGPDEDEVELLGKSKYQERGVGVQYGDSDEDLDSEDDDEDDDDLFGENDMSNAQRSEGLRLKREKRKLLVEGKRAKALLKKAERRKAQLRRAFEPVQLIENFCTDKDDAIRQADIPERMFDWKTPFYGSAEPRMTEAEREQAAWIAQHIPGVACEYDLATGSEQDLILESIAKALKFMHRDKLEASFIKRYRRDDVVSAVVREHLYDVMDKDGDWDLIISARSRVDTLVVEIEGASQVDESSGVDAEKLVKMQEDLAAAMSKLEETARQETLVKTELDSLPAENDSDDDDDDDNLFGDTNDQSLTHKSKALLSAHLATLQELMQVQAEKLATLQSQVQIAEAHSKALNDPVPMERVQKKTCRDALWNSKDYLSYLSDLVEMRHILDLNGYMKLIKEGNDAIRKKELPMMSANEKDDARKRSRRSDRDFYRSCVSEGLRSVCYRFLLSPSRAGVMLEGTVTFGKFDYLKIMPGEKNEEGAGNPLKWVAPVISSSSPREFASELVGSGELVVLQAESGNADPSDPFRGCRYVAAVELANEPRIRRHLRDIYRRNALLTTKPTKKGISDIDAFHDYYGLHLIRNKPIKDHFPLEKLELELRTAHLSDAERNEFIKEMKTRERDSCLQYLHILKAEQTSDVAVFVHLPLAEHSEVNDRKAWYDPTSKLLGDRSNQNISCLLDELKKVYLPPDGDTDEWNEERLKVLRLALNKILLPQFEAEIRKDLKDVVGTQGAISASDNLKEAVMQGPYRPTSLLHSHNRHLVPTGDLSFVGVCVSHEGGKDATYLASVTERGESNDYIAIPMGERVDAGKMREKVIMFLVQQRPAAVIIGTSGGFQSRMFHRNMSEIIREAVERWRKRDIQGEDEDNEAFELRQSMFRQMQPPGYYDDAGEEEWTCNAELVDDSISQLFGRSVRGNKEFADFPVNLRCAISVARYAKDPMAEYAYAFSSASESGVFGTEMLYLNIHPMQQLMPRTKLLRYYERTLCEVVADVGVDINTAVNFGHKRGLLMFVAGLGPRKAAMLKQSFSQAGGAIAKRRDLLEKRMVGPVVYNNAVAFLRICEADQLVDQTLHPLDDTRLHPDVYSRNNWAVKVAFDALEREDSRPKDAAAIKALRDVMENSSKELERLYYATKAEWESHFGPTFNVINWNPRNDTPSDFWRDKVEELDLNAFANMIEENKQGRWHSHLEMIKWEFRLPFADPRQPMEALKGYKLFQLITGETDQSLRAGKEVTGKVIRNGDFGSRIKLEGDIPAFIPLRNLSDEHVEAADDFVSAGQIVTATITEVKKDHMTVDLSLRMEDFRKKPSTWERPESLPALDDHFDRGASAKIEEENSKLREARLETLMINLGVKAEEDGDGATKKKRLGRVVRRACTHPAFRNATNAEVDAELKAGGASMVGEAIIRPSSKQSDSLAIHWVVREGMIRVDEVEELDKDNEASIGNTLKIKSETYGSIDELLGRYIAPMNDLVEELVNHRKFIDLPEEEVDDKLMDQKRATPKSIPYALYWLDPQMYPGYAALRFIGSVTPRGHSIGITPKGFSWGTNTFQALDRLINEFKRNPQGTSKPRETLVQAAKPAKTRWGAKPAPPPPSQPPAPPQWQEQQQQQQQQHQENPYPPQYPPQPYAQPYGYAPYQGYPPPPQNYAPPPPQNYAPPAPQGWNQQSYYPPPPGYGQPYPQPQQQPPPPQNRPPPPSGPPPPHQQQQQLPPPAFDVPEGGVAQGRGRGRTLPAWMSQQQK